MCISHISKNAPGTWTSPACDIRDMPLRGQVEHQDVGDVTRWQLTGDGTQVPQEQQLQLHNMLKSDLGAMGMSAADQSAYVGRSFDCKNVLVFSQADLPGIGTVCAESYGRAITRVSHYVEVLVCMATPGQRGREFSRLCVASVSIMISVSPTSSSLAP